jgi:hypothetical protein
MKTSHLILNVIGLLCACLLVTSAVGIYFFLLPAADADGRGVWYFVMAAESVMILLLGSGASANLAKGRLVRWPTAMMIVGAFLSVYFIPIAVWGMVALILQQKKQRDSMVEKAGGETAHSSSAPARSKDGLLRDDNPYRAP